MTDPEPLSRKQISFAVAGIIFGFLLGYVVAHEVYAGRIGAGLPRSSGASQPSVGGGPAMGASGGPPPAGAAAQGGAPSMQTMEEVTRELESLKQAVAQDPNNVAALARLGGLYMDAAMYDRALEYLESAVRIEPHDAHARTELGTCYLLMGRAAEALEQFQEAIRHDEKHAKTWYSMGFAYVESGQYEKGDEAFSKALELSPGAFDLSALRAEIEKIKARKAGS